MVMAGFWHAEESILPCVSLLASGGGGGEGGAFGRSRGGWPEIKGNPFGRVWAKAGEAEKLRLCSRTSITSTLGSCQIEVAFLQPAVTPKETQLPLEQGMQRAERQEPLRW